MLLLSNKIFFSGVEHVPQPVHPILSYLFSTIIKVCYKAEI